MFQLTGKDNLGNTCPLLINSEHIVSMRPRTGQRPTGVSQNPQVAPISMGTEISLVNGDSHIVTDSYDQIAKALTTPPPAPQADPKAHTQTSTSEKRPEPQVVKDREPVSSKPS